MADCPGPPSVLSSRNGLRPATAADSPSATEVLDPVASVSARDTSRRARRTGSLRQRSLTLSNVDGSGSMPPDLGSDIAAARFFRLQVSSDIAERVCSSVERALAEQQKVFSDLATRHYAELLGKADSAAPPSTPGSAGAESRTSTQVVELLDSVLQTSMTHDQHWRSQLLSNQKVEKTLSFILKTHPLMQTMEGLDNMNFDDAALEEELEERASIDIGHILDGEKGCFIGEDDDEAREEEDEAKLNNTVHETVVGTAYAHTGEEDSIGEITPQTRPLVVFVHSTQFEVFCAAVIILNAVFIAVTTELAMAHALEVATTGSPRTSWQPDGSLLVLGQCFFVFFSVELLLKIFAYRWLFFTGPDRGWNIFDLALVMTGLWDSLTELAGMDAPGQGILWLRLVRLLKMTKLFRVVRVFRWFDGLRIIVMQLRNSVSLLIWLLVLLAAILLVFSLFFVQALESLLISSSVDSLDPIVLDRIRRDWTSVLQAMTTLLASMMGGVSMEQISSTLLAAGDLYFWVLIFFMIFSAFVFSNIVNGVFVDAALKGSYNDYDMVVEERMRAQKQHMERLTEVFLEIDENHDGSFSREELETALTDNKVKVFFYAFDIEPHDAMRLFTMLQRGGSHQKVSSKAFLDGCMRLKGSAKAIDMVCLMAENHHNAVSLTAFMGYVDDHFTEMMAVFAKMGYQMEGIQPLQERLPHH